jgi:hypothetical protein
MSSKSARAIEKAHRKAMMSKGAAAIEKAHRKVERIKERMEIIGEILAELKDENAADYLVGVAFKTSSYLLFDPKDRRRFIGAVERELDDAWHELNAELDNIDIDKIMEEE